MADLYQFNFEMDENKLNSLQEYDLSYFREEYYNDAAVTKIENFEKDNQELQSLKAQIDAERAKCEADDGYSRERLNDLEAKYVEKFDNSFAGSESSPKRVGNLIKTYQEVKKLNNSKLEKNFEFLMSFSEGNQESGYAEDGNVNVSRLQIKTGQDGSPRLLMVMKNLRGTGLDFTIEDGRSIVFAKDAKLTRAQVQAFARFFADNGMNINDFSSLADIKVFEDDGKEIGSFEDNFKQEYDNFANQNPEQEFEGMDSPAGEVIGGQAPEAVGTYKDYINSTSNNRASFNRKEIKKAIKKRAKIAGYNSRLLKTIQMPDGSFCICGYADSNAMIDDMKTDKDGHVKHTKDFAVRVYPTNPPSAQMYLRPGAEFKASHAKMVIASAKACGCTEISIVSTGEISGAETKAWFEASGDQLFPIHLKQSANDDGFDGFNNDHLQAMLKAIKDKGQGQGDNDTKEILLYKMRVIENIEGYNRYKESIGEKGVNQSVRTAVSHMHGDIKFGMFNVSYKGQLEKYINDKVEKGGWNTADLAAAYIAMGKVLKAVETGKDSNGKNIGYDYLDRNGNNMEILQNVLVKEIDKARPQVRAGILKHLQGERGMQDVQDFDDLDNNDAQAGNAVSRAANNFLNQTKELLQKNVVGPLKDGYGESADFKFDITGRAGPATQKDLKKLPKTNNNIPISARSNEGR